MKITLLSIIKIRVQQETKNTKKKKLSTKLTHSYALLQTLKTIQNDI